MRQAFTILYSKVVLGLILAAGVAGLVVSRLRRRLRVAADQRVRAPVLWLVNMTGDARLHRRLRRLASRAREIGRGRKWHRGRHRHTAAQRLAFDLEAEVVELAERLVESRSLDHDAQQVVVKAVRTDADRIDTLLDRVEVVIEREAANPSTTRGADPIATIAGRLERLEALTDSRAAGVIDASAAAVAPHELESRALDSPA